MPHADRTAAAASTAAVAPIAAERAQPRPAPGRHAADPARQAVVAEIARRHARERSALLYIASLLPKVAGRFRARDGRLDVLCDAGQDLVDTLEAYMDDAERRLLPAAAAVDAPEVVRGELDRHNRELQAMLAHIRSLAGGFVSPDWGDGQYRALMEELETLEADVKARVRIEDRELVSDGDQDRAADGARWLARLRRAGRGLALAIDDEE